MTIFFLSDETAGCCPTKVTSRRIEFQALEAGQAVQNEPFDLDFQTEDGENSLFSLARQMPDRFWLLFDMAALQDSCGNCNLMRRKQMKRMGTGFKENVRFSRIFSLPNLSVVKSWQTISVQR